MPKSSESAADRSESFDSVSEHPTLAAVLRGLNALAVVVFLAIGAYLGFRLFMAMPACLGAASAESPSPYCVMAPLRKSASPLLSHELIEPLTTRTNSALLAVALGAAGVRIIITNRWPGLSGR